MAFRRCLIVMTMVLLTAVSASAAMVCSQCGKTISGGYYTAGNQVYCSQACVLESRPACVVCGKKKLKGGYRRNGEYVCSDVCLKALSPACDLCRQPILVGKMMTLEGRHYCELCFKTPTCAQCGHPAGGSRLPDGRPYCLTCVQNGINSASRADRIYIEVKQRMRERLGIATDPTIRFHLVDLNALSTIAGRQPLHERGLYRHTERTTQEVAVLGVRPKKFWPPTSITARTSTY